MATSSHDAPGGTSSAIIAEFGPYYSHRASSCIIEMVLAPTRRRPAGQAHPPCALFALRGRQTAHAGRQSRVGRRQVSAAAKRATSGYLPPAPATAAAGRI